MTELAVLLARAGGGHVFGGGFGGSSGGGGSSFGGGGLGRGFGGGLFFLGGGFGNGGSGIAIFIIIMLLFAALRVVIARRRRVRRSGIEAGSWSPGSGTVGSGQVGTQPWDAQDQTAGGAGSSAPGAPGSGGHYGSGAYGSGAYGSGAYGSGGSGSGSVQGSSEQGWSHDDRPAAATIRGDVLPGTANTAMAAPAMGGMTLESGLSEIRAHDPGFDAEAFAERVQRAFFVVQEAWTQRKPEMSRAVMAEGLWQQHRTQIQGYLDSGKRNVLEDLSVADIRLLSAHSDATYDTITVRIVAACADYDVNDANGKVVRGNRRVEPWQEDWTFQRSSSATTRPDGGTLEQHCPNCGAPLDLDLAGVCHYCHQPVMSGAYDWVLARISQVG